MKKQITAWILLAAMLTGLLSACGNGAADGSQAVPDELTAKYTYQAQYLDLDVDASEQFDTIVQYCVSGNALYFAGSRVNGATVSINLATGEPVVDTETGRLLEMDAYEAFLFRTDLDSGETVRLDGYAPLALAEGQLGSADVAAMAAGADGTVWILDYMDSCSYNLPEDFDAQTDSALNYYVPNGRTVSLRQFDADGHFLKAVDASGLDAQYPSEMLVDQAGNFYINTEDAIYLLDPEGAVLAKLKSDSARITLCQGGGAEIGALCTDLKTGKKTFRPIDPNTGAFGTQMELPNGTLGVYPGFADFQYLYDDSAAVYGWNAETGETEKLLSWLDCGVNRSSFDRFTMLEDGRIVTLTIGDANCRLLCLSQADPSAPEQAQEMQTLTLGCSYLGSTMSEKILEFNLSHSDVQIVVKDYSEYDAAKLYTELLAGDMPDIIYNTSLPLDEMASMGMLVDLWPLIDGDEEFGREDLMTHLFDVMSIDGKLYEITNHFFIQTAVGNADVIGDRTGWTLDEMLEVWETLPEGAFISNETETKENILSICVNHNLGSFIDWEAQTCSFDSAEFIDILNFAGSFPAEFDWTDYVWAEDDDTYGRFQNNMQLIQDYTIISFEDMQVCAAVVGGSPCYVGYPSAAGNGTVLWPGESMVITAACQNVDLAWSFVRTLLTEEYQRENSNSGFPTNRHAFDALVEQQMNLEPVYKTDPETGEQVEVDRTTAWGQLEIKLTPLTQEEYDTFLRLYESCSSVYSYNDAVWKIIIEEAAPFFDGQKTAEEVAALIQDRVGLYVMEQG